MSRPYPPPPPYPPRAVEYGPTLTGPSVLKWATVRTGLSLVLIGMSLAALGLLLLGLAQILTQREMEKVQKLMTYLHMFATVALLFGGVLSVAGICLGVAMPDEAPGKTGIVLYLITLGLIAGTMFLLFVASMENSDAQRRRSVENLRAIGRVDEKPLPTKEDALPWTPTLLKGLSYLLQVLCLLNAVCVHFFLMGVARHFRRPTLAVLILLYMLFTTLLGLGLLALRIFAPEDALAELPRKVGETVFSVMVFGGSVLLVVCLLLLILSVRGAVARALGQWAEKK